MIIQKVTAPKLALGALLLAVVAAVSVGAGAVLFADATPRSLQQSSEVTAAPIIQRSFDDTRSVEVKLILATETALTSPISGRITAFSCLAGDVFTSGATSLSVDGQPILNLATSVPLWRHLSLGDNGEDVSALQQELTRLDYKVASDGVMDNSTLVAVADLFRKNGSTGFRTGAVPIDRILWLPAVETTVGACTASIGTSIMAGDEIVSLPSGLADAAITRLPEDLVAGDRVLTIDGENVPVEPDGRVTEADALAVISASSSYEQALRGETTSLTGGYGLSEPVTVSVVPPGALYDIGEASACISNNGEPIEVQIVGSELGQSFITFDPATQAPDEVDLNPDERQSCR